MEHCEVVLCFCTRTGKPVTLLWVNHVPPRKICETVAKCVEHEPSARPFMRDVCSLLNDAEERLSKKCNIS